MKYAKNKKGFTVIELMITISLLLLLVTLAYQVFGHLLGTYSRTERKWLLERSAHATLTGVTDSVDTALSAKLINAPEMVDALSSQTINRIIAENGKIYFVKAGETTYTEVNTDKIATTLEFVRVPKDTGYYGNAVGVRITTTDGELSYTEETTVSLPNLTNSMTWAEDSASYASIEYLTQDDTGGITLDKPSGCFIATAAYGEYDEPGVMLLRRFRDQVLLTNAPGQWFVTTYYRLSPPIADVIAVHPALRLCTRVALLPLQGAAVVILHPVFSGFVLLGCTVAYKKGRQYRLRKGKKLH